MGVNLRAKVVTDSKENLKFWDFDSNQSPSYIIYLEFDLMFDVLNRGLSKPFKFLLSIL